MHCSKPSSNTSAATKREMVEMQGMFKQRNKAIAKEYNDTINKIVSMGHKVILIYPRNKKI